MAQNNTPVKALVLAGGAFLMLGRLERGTLKTIKSFYEV